MSFPTEIDYSKKPYLEPRYKLSQIYQQTGGQKAVIGASGGNESVFELPVKVFNLAKSSLNFQIEPTGLAANYNWIINDCVAPIRQIQLYTRGGLFLCDLNEVGNYTKIVSKPETKMDDFLTYPKMQAQDILPYTAGRFLAASNSLASADTRTAVAPYSGRYEGEDAFVNYIEPKYLEPGTVGADSPLINIQLPLEHFKNTIFGLNKDLYFGEVILMKVIWASYLKCGFTSDTADDPTHGYAELAADIDILNLIFYLAIEQNERISQQVISQVASGGLNILIPYTYMYKYNPGETNSATVTTRLSRANGIRLQKIYLSAFFNDERGSTAYDCSNAVPGGNADNSKVATFYTAMDNNRLQDINVNCVNMEDYMMLKEKIKGSVISSQEVYRYNWFWLEDFTGAENKVHDDYSNLETGLDLSTERKYDFFMLSQRNGTATAYNFYTYAVCQKMLSVGPNGIMLN